VPADWDGERVKVIVGSHDTVLLLVPAHVPATPDTAIVASVPGVKVPMPDVEVAVPAE
jgi:hypothetical protein